MKFTDRSKINPKMIFSEDKWILSIVRNEKSANKEHAYILLEGIETLDDGNEVVVM